VVAAGAKPLAVLAACAVLGAACSSSHHSSARVPTTSTSSTVAGPTTTVPNLAVKPSCAYNPETEAITGALGSASAIGWAGNGQGVVTCLGGTFYVGNGIDRAFGFGIYGGGATGWSDTDGYLPAQVTSFRHGRAKVTITEFADRVVVSDVPYVAVYSRVAVDNPTDDIIAADPKPTPGMVPLNDATVRVPARGSATHDYVVAVDRFGAQAPWPSNSALSAAGGYNEHFSHMRAFWDDQLRQIAMVEVPDRGLEDAYKSGFIYTQIARSGTHLNTGVNNYAAEFSHDVIGILANLFTQGYDTDAHALLLEANAVVRSQGQYEDGAWTYSWPWAIYLLKTGDLAFVRANFADIASSAHRIAADRTGPGGIIGRTDDIDTQGLWTVDDYEALTGLAAYRYLAERSGDAMEASWATREYESLLAATNRTLTDTIRRFHQSYLPCSMIAPNTANRCARADDANWAAPFLFGRWAWDAKLFGAAVTGPGVNLIDATYDYGFKRLHGTLPPDTFGGYPNDYFTTGYNAGYGSWGLASSRYRDQGIRGYEFLIDNGQSGPYSWWESLTSPPPRRRSPWIGSHPAAGQGSSPHAWGIANANKVLLDSLVAQAADTTLVVGRGVPTGWLSDELPIKVTNFPTTDGHRIGASITSSHGSVTLTLNGTPPGEILFQVPAFVDNIASTSAGTVDEPTGTIRLAPNVNTVTVQLKRWPA
jgi:hypothetical protein